MIKRENRMIDRGVRGLGKGRGSELQTEHGVLMNEGN